MSYPKPYSLWFGPYLYTPGRSVAGGDGSCLDALHLDLSVSAVDVRSESIGSPAGLFDPDSDFATTISIVTDAPVVSDATSEIQFTATITVTFDAVDIETAVFNDFDATITAATFVPPAGALTVASDFGTTITISSVIYFDPFVDVYAELDSTISIETDSPASVLVLANDFDATITLTTDSPAVSVGESLGQGAVPWLLPLGGHYISGALWKWWPIIRVDTPGQQPCTPGLHLDLSVSTVDVVSEAINSTGSMLANEFDATITIVTEALDAAATVVADDKTDFEATITIVSDCPAVAADVYADLDSTITLVTDALEVLLAAYTPFDSTITIVTDAPEAEAILTRNLGTQTLDIDSDAPAASATVYADLDATITIVTDALVVDPGFTATITIVTEAKAIAGAMQFKDFDFPAPLTIVTEAPYAYLELQRVRRTVTRSVILNVDVGDKIRVRSLRTSGDIDLILEPKYANVKVHYVADS